MTLAFRTADRLRFGVAWTLFGTKLYCASLVRKRFVPPPVGLRAATHVTLVARLPSQITEPIKEIVASLGKSAAKHYVYPAETIHLTVQNLDPLMHEIDDLEEMRERLRILVGSFVPMRMVAQGLGISPDTAFIQIFPEDMTLAKLRREIRTLMFARFPPSRFTSGYPRSRQLFRHMAFANVMRFSGIVTPSFIRKIANHRSRYFGAFSMATVELVVTDRFLSAEGTHVKEQMSFRMPI